MADASRHYAQASKVLEILQTLSFTGFSSSDIQLMDDWEDYPQSRGIFVSMIEETFGVGTNEKTDVRYAVRIVRVAPKAMAGKTEQMQARSEFRRSIVKRFDRQRIGLDAPTCCEIVTRARSDVIKMKPAWKREQLDVSAMVVTTLVRETRYSG